MEKKEKYARREMVETGSEKRRSQRDDTLLKTRMFSLLLDSGIDDVLFVLNENLEEAW